MGARLLPTWMFLNSLQLIAHTPLLATYMPANLNYFLIKLLKIARLNVDKIDEYMEAWEKQQGMDNYEMTSEDGSLFTYLLNDCGYKLSFQRNLVVIIMLTLLLTFIIIVFACWDATQ